MYVIKLMQSTCINIFKTRIKHDKNITLKCTQKQNLVVSDHILTQTRKLEMMSAYFCPPACSYRLSGEDRIDFAVEDTGGFKTCSLSIS